MTISARASRLAALAVWASFFALLWFTGDGHRYLGSRTMWVIPFGAVLTALVAGVLAVRPARASAPPHRSEAIGAGLLLVPVLVALAAPHAELGASAAEQRAADPSSAARLIGNSGNAGTGINYTDIMFAQTRSRYGVHPGAPVRLIGFAMRKPGTPDGMFQIARFYLTCCVADATVLYATVDPTGDVPPRNSWLDLTGTMERRDGQYIVRANNLRQIPAPKYPYLTAAGGSTTLRPIAGGTRPPDPRTVKVTPYRPPKAPPARYTLPATSTSRDGITITVDRVEFANTETRVFATIANDGRRPLTIFPTNADLTGNTTAISEGRAYTAMSGSAGHHMLRTTLPAGTTTTGILTFPHLNPNAPLRVVFDALSDDPAIGQQGNLEIELAWHTRASATR